MIETKKYFIKQQTRLRVAAVIEKDDSILLVFDPVYRGGCWILPGGGAEFNETINQAIEREVFEETGLQVSAREICGIREIWEPENDYPDVQKVRKSIEIFFSCEYISGEINIQNNPSNKHDGISRIKDCRWVPRNECGDISGYPVYPADFLKTYFSGKAARITIDKILLPPLNLVRKEKKL
jgi:8-oxo-dGTP diphosphatase